MIINKLKGLENLLDLNGLVIAQEQGYWVKFEVFQVSISEHIPHGISYSLTLHDNHNQRVMGFDNAHAPKGYRKKKYTGRVVEYDHHHKNEHCKGVPYEFDTPVQLISEFWQTVDDVLHRQGIIE